ncbi:MAG: hypothetical protein NUV49_03160 [Patescibacteria group bacterium]|nr:hypothetical protein [Patescibacteria group bacterium]
MYQVNINKDQFFFKRGTMRKRAKYWKRKNTTGGVFSYTLFPFGLVMVMIGTESIGATGSFLPGVGISIFGFCVMTLVIRKMNAN